MSNKNIKKYISTVFIALIVALFSFFAKDILPENENNERTDVSYNSDANNVDNNTANNVDIIETESSIVEIQQLEQSQEAQSIENNTKQDLEQTVTYNFRKQQYLTEHFQKHGAEFPYDTEEEYLQGANNVINNKDSLHKIEAEDGDDVYYLESTNEFVIVSTDGYIRTYFKPSKGIEYYNRQ